MASRRTLLHRLLNFPKAAVPPPPRRPTTTTTPTLLHKLLGRSDGDGSFRRSLHHNRAPAFRAERLALPTGNELLEKLRSLNPDRVHLEALSPLVSPSSRPEGKKETGSGADVGLPISVEEARKVLRASQMEAVKARLRGVQRSSVSYAEFIHMCRGDAGVEHGLGVAKALDDSGSVIVLGDVVLLRPDQVARAIEGAIPRRRASTNEEEEELEELERKKVEIDKKAEAGVRKELWCGLGLLATQTLGFMRLTFWELSWDVMEPICFYVTSAYFMAGYAFFLRTSRDPSFEGFFDTRFAAHQRKLMKAARFDLDRLHELRRLVHGNQYSVSPPTTAPSPSSKLHPFCDCHGKDSTLLSVVNH